MSRIFPPQSRAVAGRIVLGMALLGLLAAAGTTYYATPKYTRVGYEPLQVVSFSHQLHVGQIGMDCRYCHTHVEHSPHANIPAVQTCMNCHDPAKGNIKGDSPALAPVRQAYASGQPLEWTRVHKVPDFVYFNHAVHVARGVGCVSCHGQVNQMPLVRHMQSLSMSWCLDCHRNPAPWLRPAREATNMNWQGRQGLAGQGLSLNAFQAALMDSAKIVPPTHCTGCHR